MRRFLSHTALVLVTLLIACAACEALVRVMYGESTVLFPRYHTDYRYGPYAIRGIRPNSRFRHTSVAGSWEFITNSRGLRSTRNHDYPKPPRTFRVLALGDSHTQGYEVRQTATYAAGLERYLDSHGSRAEVLNAGVSGFSTAEALVYLENEGIRYQPDAVVLGFYANDFVDNVKAGLFGLDGTGRLSALKFEHLPGVRVQNAIYALAPVRWLSENSHFYSLLFNNTWNFFKVQLAAPSTDAGIAVDTLFEHAVAGAGPVPPEQVALASALIIRMHEFCAKNGVRLIVVDIPRRTGPYHYASSMPPALVQELGRAGVEFLPSEHVFAGMNGSVELHVPHGHHHISETAHALLATAVGGLLRPR